MPTDAPAGRAEVDRYLEALRPVLHDLASQGRLVGDPEEVAGALAIVLPRPAPSRWAERIGPVYTTGQLQRLLPGPGRKPISDEAVRDRCRNGRLIGFKTADGRWAWPAFQFVARQGRIEPAAEIIDVWQLLPWRDGHALELISWMTGPRRDLEGASPLDHVHTHGIDQRVEQAAGRLAGRLAA